MSHNTLNPNMTKDSTLHEPTYNFDLAIAITSPGTRSFGTPGYRH